MVSAQHLPGEPDDEYAAEIRSTIEEKNRSAQELASFSIEPRNWSSELDAVVGQVRMGTSILAYDELSSEELDQVMDETMFGFLGGAEKSSPQGLSFCVALNSQY